MTEILNRLLAFTRHGARSTANLCTTCIDAALREELSSLSHAADVERLMKGRK